MGVDLPVYKVDKQRSSSSRLAFEMNFLTPPLSERFIASTLNYSIVIVTGFRVRGSNTTWGKRMFPSPNRRDRLGVPPILVFNG